MYKAIVHFTKKTEIFGIVVEQSLPHVDKEHAECWVKAMGKKIWNVRIEAL